MRRTPGFRLRAEGSGRRRFALFGGLCQRESSQASSSGLRFQRGGALGRVEGSTSSMARLSMAKSRSRCFRELIKTSTVRLPTQAVQVRRLHAGFSSGLEWRCTLNSAVNTFEVVVVTKLG